MLDLCARLKARHALRVAVVSNEARELNEHRIRRFRLSGLVDLFVSSCFVHLRKPDAEMLLVVCLTDVAHVALATDRVRPSSKPETWNIGPLVRVSVALGALTLVEALGLLAFGWRRFGLASDASRLQTFTFQTFLFFALSSLVSVRGRRAFFRSRPSAALIASLAAAALAGVIIGLRGVAELSALPFAQSALIFGYATVCSLGPNDLVKTVLCARALGHARRDDRSPAGPRYGQC